MREIKFRYYHPSLGMIYSSLTDSCKDHSGKIIPGTSKIDWYEVNKRQYPIMQYTGFNTSDGQEVYEGDLVKVKRDDSFSSWDHGQVEFCEGVFIINTYHKSNIIEKRLMNGNVFMYLHDWPELKVMGNICENPGALDHE